MKVIIIEDEAPAARRLERLVEQFDGKVMASLPSVQESVAYLRANTAPDLIFLDIQLSDGLSFEIFDQVQVNCPVIFITAYDSYALQAFRVNSIDYLLKPIDKEELKRAMDKYFGVKAWHHGITFNFDDVRRYLVNPLEREYKQRFSVRVGHQIKLISTEDIECLYSENKGSWAHTSENRGYLLEGSLEQIAEELDPNTFFRISRKHVINLKYIQKITEFTNARLQVQLASYDQEALIVSRERVRDFKDWLG